MLDPLSKESAELVFRTTFLNNPYLRKHSVSPQQFLFLCHPAKEILFGGQAGGGKSYVLLMAALQFVIVPNYSALLLRRTFADLQQPGALIPLSHEILAGTDAKWDGQRYRWLFPNGATLQFGYMDTEIDKYRYQGAVFQFVGYDEATQFTESMYLYPFSRLRRVKDMPVPLRVRAATNPGGISHQFFKDRFIRPKEPDPNRVFIPAKMSDNPWLDQQSYIDSLKSLDHVTRSQLRDGNWDISALGNAFKPEWFRKYDHTGNLKGGDGAYILGDRRIPMNECTRFATADIAGTEAQKHTDPDWTVIQVWDHAPSGDLMMVYQYRGRHEIPEVEQHLCRTHWDYGCEFAAVEKNGIGLPVVQTARRRGLAIRAIVAKRDKFARSQAAQILMENGQVWFPPNWPGYEDFMSECLAFPSDDAMHDDQVDALSIACQQVGKSHGPRPTPRQGEHDAATADAEAAQEAEEAEERHRRFVEEVLGDDRRIWHEMA